jgi:hypothetical protein
MRVISDYELSRTIVASRAFGAYPMADGYKEMSARFGHDFAPAIALLERLPTFMDGEPHSGMRQAMARIFGVVRQPQLAAAKDFLAGFATIRLQPGQSFDLMDDMSRPLFRAMNRVAITAQGLPEPVLDLIDEIPLLFSPFTALKTRLAINARIGTMIADHGTDILCDVGLMSLGVRPLTGGLARSIHATVAAHQGSLLSAMHWPARISLSPVTYVDRICLEPTDLVGESFATGEHIRCEIQVRSWTQEQRQGTMFGAGSHLCLGRPISEQVWTHAAELFAARDLRASAGPLTMKPGSDPFELPAHCPISIEA